MSASNDEIIAQLDEIGNQHSEIIEQLVHHTLEAQHQINEEGTRDLCTTCAKLQKEIINHINLTTELAKLISTSEFIQTELLAEPPTDSNSANDIKETPV